MLHQVRFLVRPPPFEAKHLDKQALSEAVASHHLLGAA